MSAGHWVSGAVTSSNTALRTKRHLLKHHAAHKTSPPRVPQETQLQLLLGHEPLVISVPHKHLIQEQRITGVTLVKYEGGNVTQSGKAQKKSFRSCTYLHLQNWVKSDPTSWEKQMLSSYPFETKATNAQIIHFCLKEKALRDILYSTGDLGNIYIYIYFFFFFFN